MQGKDTQLESLAERVSKSKEDLEQELDDTLEEVQKENDSLPDEQAKKIAWNRFQASWRKRLASGGEVYEVVVIGVGNRVNYNKSEYNEAIKMYDQDPETAIEKGIVKEDENGDPVPLHYIPEEDRGSAPQWQLDRLGEPLDEENWGRTLYVCVYDNETDQWRPAEINARDEASKREPSTFVEAEVELYKRDKSTDAMWHFYESGDFEFDTKDELDHNQVRELLDNTWSDKKFTLNEFEEYDDKVGRYEPGILEAMVTSIGSTRTDNGNLRVEIQDDTLDLFGDDGGFNDPVTAWFPESVEIDFPERAEVILFGTTNIYTDDDGNERKNFNVMGCYTPPHFRNNIPESDDVGSEDDAEW